MSTVAARRRSGALERMQRREVSRQILDHELEDLPGHTSPFNP